MSDKLTACIRLYQAFQNRSSMANREVREVLGIRDEQKARRYIESLVEAGVPLRRVGVGSATRYETDLDWRRRALHFSLGDALSLQFGRKMLSFLEGTDVPGWLDDLREKLDVNASSSTLDSQSAFARKLVYLSEPYRPYERHNDTLDALITALLAERTLLVEYASRAGLRSYTLEPLVLVVYRRALYLVGRSTGDGRIRRLPVDRFETAALGPAFRYPTDFDGEAYVSTSFGIFDGQGEPDEVRLRFRADVADLVRARRWHATQRFEPLDDGRLDLVMLTQGPELGRLALEWGDRVEVLSPPSLRRRVRDELQAALAQYVDSDTQRPHTE